MIFFSAYFQLIECQVSTGWVSNGPMLASTCTLNFPLKLTGARHEYLQVPPQPNLNLPEVRTLSASSTMLKPGAGCRCLFLWGISGYLGTPYIFLWISGDIGYLGTPYIFLIGILNKQEGSFYKKWLGTVHRKRLTVPNKPNKN